MSGSETSGEVTPPFTDLKGAGEYAVGVWHHLGPEKGLLIQNILLNLGLASLNDLRPYQYKAFYKAMEALNNNG